MSNTIPDIMKTVTPSSNNNSNNISKHIPKSLLPTSNDNGGADIIKITLIVGIILFLAYNLYLYLTEGTDVLGKYFAKMFFMSLKEKNYDALLVVLIHVHNSFIICIIRIIH